MVKYKLRRVDDPLWKSILEQTFADFLRFMFPEAELLFDLNKPFEYLDKEFETLFPPEKSNKGKRFVDKLVKVYMKGGGEQFIFCHIEVQSNKGNNDLEKRMFEYYYKITDRYQVPVCAIAILTDENKHYKPKLYVQSFLGTSLKYEFNYYKILSQNEEDLRSNPNPFAVVVLTAYLAIVYNHVTDQELKDIKHDLYEQMMKRDMEKSTRQGIYDFLAYYVSFEDQEIFIKFEQEIDTKLGRSTTMGTREYLLDKAKREGQEQERGLAAVRIKKLEAEKEKLEAEREKAEVEKFESATKMLNSGFDVAMICDILSLTPEQVEKLK